MKTKVSRSEAQEKISLFFQREKFSADEVKKIKRLAMKFNIKLGKNRRRFCKKCFSQLKGKTRVSKTHRTIECEACGFLNRHNY